MLVEQGVAEQKKKRVGEIQMSSYPTGYDIVVYISGLYEKGDIVKYWGAMPGRLSSEHRAFIDGNNEGVTTVNEDGALVVRARTPRPFISKDTGKVMSRCLYFTRRRRGRYSDRWCDKVHTLFILTDRRVNKIDRALSVPHGLFTDTNAFHVAGTRKKAGIMQKKGVVEVYIKR